MKRKMKKLLVTLLSAIMVLSSFTMTAAAEEQPDGYEVYIGFGGDAAEANDWGYQYNSPNADNNVGEVTATNGVVKVGETVTVSLTLPSANLATYWIAPVIVAEGVSNLDATVQCSIDGTDITDTIDFAADSEGRTWWYEATGAYAETQAIRLAGGYNEWGAKFIPTSPIFTTVEYTITLNSIEFGEVVTAETPVAVAESDYEGSVDLIAVFGGDAVESGDWAFQYYGDGASTNVGEVTATNGTIAVGETTTVSLEFPSPVVYTYFTAPMILAEGITSADFSVKVFIDGEEVATDLTAGDNFWYEATGDYTDTQAIRIAGGYNEWGTKYLAESPTGFTKLEYEVTCNSLKTGGAAEAEAPAPEADLNGTYNAYLLLQTPNWTFRDAFNDANGIGSENWGQWIKNNDTGLTYGVVTDAVIEGNGTYTVSITDFGTVFADDFAAASAEIFNIIGMSTDIPLESGITISNVTLKIDGKTIQTDAEAYLDPDAKDYSKVIIQNIWNADRAEISYYAAPSESLEIEFTVSGLAYDNAASAPAEDAETPDAEPADDTAASTDTESSSNTTVIIIVVVAVVVVIAVVAAVVISKKKKGSKAE